MPTRSREKMSQPIPVRRKIHQCLAASSATSRAPNISTLAAVTARLFAGRIVFPAAKSANACAASALLSGGSGCLQLAPPREHPLGAREVARVPVRVALEIVLMLGLRLPERPRRRHLGHDLPGPQARRLDLRDRLLGDAALVVVEIEDRRAI